MARKAARGPTPHAYAPWSAAQTYIFDGTTTKGGGLTEYSFYVLAGAGAPVIKDGGPQVQTINLPRRKAYTYVLGYNPVQMDVPIQFEALTDRHGHWAITPNLEADVQKLMWMWGRGKLWPAGQAAVGDSPLVTIASFDGTGRQTNLIPPDVQYHGRTSDIRWLVSGLEFDSSEDGCIRNARGDRVRQRVTVTLVEFSAIPGTSTENSPSARQNARGSGHGYMVRRSSQKDNTVAKITRRYTQRNDTASYHTVLSLSRTHGVKVRSALQALPLGTPVYIPLSLLP